MGGMSQQEFQNYLGLLGRLLRLRTAQRKAIEDELRAHMEERFAALSSQGIEPEQAVSMALAEFGDAAALAAEFTAISRLQKRRWMMRFTIGSIAATILLSAVVVSMWPDGSGQLADPAAQAQQVQKPAPPKAEKTAPEQDANAQTQAKLETHTSAEFIESPLTDVLDYLADVAKVQVYVDHPPLHGKGIDAATAPVTMHLKDVPAEMVLRLALRQQGLAYMLDHGVAIVTTPEEVEKNRDIRVYCIRDLIQQPGMAEATMGPGSDAVVRSHITALIELITSTVDPTSWEEVGGSASIRQYRGALVIAQTYQGQRKVEKLLQGLRDALAEQPAPAGGPEPATP
jgi:hypothetical protein